MMRELLREHLEAFFAWRFCGETAGCSGHLCYGPGDGRIFQDNGVGCVPGAAGGGVIVGDGPLCGTGEGFGDVLVVQTEGVGNIAVENDLEISAAVDKEMRDEAIGVAQF